jgi:hypothetical protein
MLIIKTPLVFGDLICILLAKLMSSSMWLQLNKAAESQGLDDKIFLEFVSRAQFKKFLCAHVGHVYDQK